jgi:simple sugar transport system ATP-binding protein
VASVAENLLLGNQRTARFSRWWGIDRRALGRFAAERLEAVDARPRDPEAPLGALSGGNQQKVVVARELARGAAVLLAAQPTRGLDFAAAARIYEEILRARDAGAAVLLVSTDLGEVRALADRVAVFFRGEVAGTLAREDASEDALAPLFSGAR